MPTYLLTWNPTEYPWEWLAKMAAGTANDEHRLIAFLDELRQQYRVRSVVFDKWQSLVSANPRTHRG